MSEKIEASDILGEGAKRGIDEFNQSVRDTVVIVKQLNKTVEAMQKNPLDNSSNIAQHNKDMAESIKLENALSVAKLKSEKIALDQLKQEEKLQNSIRKSQEENIKNTSKQDKEQANLNSVYQQTTKRYNELSKAQMELSIRGRENGKVFKAIKIEADALRASLDKAEQGAGRFQRNVGNYKSGFNGLSSSVNQLTREMPAFANSMQTGFMAISNNLPIFFDEISKANKELKALKAQGEQVPSLFKSIASSIFTFGTLLSVGVTLLTVYGKEMVQFVIDMAKGDEAFKLSGERQSEYYSKLKEYHDETFESTLRLKVLNGEMSEKSAEEWRTNYKKKTEQIILEEAHNKRLLEIAEKFKVDVSKVNGSLPESEIQKGGKLIPGSSRGIPQYTQDKFVLLTKNKEINAAFVEEQKRFNYSVQEMEIANQLKLQEIKAGKDPKVKKDKAFKLTDQDKRVLDEMETMDKKKMESVENLKKWTEESEEEQLKNTLKNIKTESDAVIDAHNADVESIEKLQREKDAREKQRQKDELQSTLNFIEAINRAKQTSLEKQLDADLDMRQRNILQQQQLAIAGKDNTLAFEKAAAAKDELRKIELAKKEEKRVKALAFLKLVSAYADKGDADGAVTKSLIQMAIAGAIIGSYEKGTEDTGGAGDVDGKGGKWAILHPHERVVTKEQNKMIGDISNEELAQIAKMHNEGLLPKYITNSNSGSFAENITNSLLIQQFSTLNSKIESIEKALKERPVSHVNLNNLGEVIDTKIVNGFHKQTLRKSNSPLNYI